MIHFHRKSLIALVSNIHDHKKQIFISAQEYLTVSDMKFFNAVAMLPLASAHFLLQYPTTVGFDDDKEGESPCGSFTNFTGGAMTSIQVGGFPIQLQSEHPEADWEFRAMLGTNGTNWTTLMPIVHQVGLGDFCIPDFKAPEEWAGQSGLLQVIQNAADGMLYQVIFHAHAEDGELIKGSALRSCI